MNPVEISFDCLPLRSVGRFDVPIDATEEEQVLYERIKLAAEKHGVHNAYYLHNARCVFHLTNDPAFGTVHFRFEGTVLTAADDLNTRHCDVAAELVGETCDWLTQPAVEWLAETVGHAVRVEFDRYISAGDLEKTVKRIEQLQAETEAKGGFLGMGL
jgi:UDP-N-acetyl-D-mannosaminuronic acid transferase (WecB/TagA/CpsF family)